MNRNFTLFLHVQFTLCTVISIQGFDTPKKSVKKSQKCQINDWNFLAKLTEIFVKKVRSPEY